RPNASLAEPGIQLRDIEGDGHLDVMVVRPGVAGYYARTPDEGWETFRRVHRVPNVDPADPSIQWIDLTGDGRADLLVSGDQVYTFWPSAGREGFAAGSRVGMPHHDDLGPRVSFKRVGEQVFVADMTGDGLPDLVRVLNGNICY